MIILRNKLYSSHSKLYKEWKKTGDPEIAYKWSQAWNSEVYDKARDKSSISEPDPEIVKSATEYVKSKDPEKWKSLERHNTEVMRKYKLSKLGQETDEDIREAVKGTKAEKKVNKILTRSRKEMTKASQKEYTKQDREVAPDDIVQ